MKPEITTLPSGKTIMRFFHRAGQLANETHSYADPQSGRPAILIAMRFESGKKVRELYTGRAQVDGVLVAGRAITRETYEQQRLQFPDMPAADASVVDESSEHLAKMEREHREHLAAAVRLGLDPSKLTELDLFCVKLMDKGRADAVEWIRSEAHTLGEMDHPESRQLISKLTELGAVAIYVCEIDPDGENTGCLVVELPGPSPAREALRAELARLAGEQGFDGDPEKGQRFAYVKLD